MKIALYIEDGVQQIVLTPDSDVEKSLLGKVHELYEAGELKVRRGSFYECRGGFIRQGANDDSTILLVEAR